MYLYLEMIYSFSQYRHRQNNKTRLSYGTRKYMICLTI